MASCNSLIGNTDITSIKGQVNFTTFSDGRFKRKIREDIPGLEFILKLRPVTYQVETNKIAAFLGETENGKSRSNSQQIVRYSGFIAQEVEKIANQINYEFSGIDKPKNERSLYGIRYAEFVVPLVQGMQEQQEIIQSLEEELEKNRIKTEDLESELEEVKILVNQLIWEKSKEDRLPSSKSARLEQNKPNPFNGTTKIKYFLPQKINNAWIRIYDISRRVVKEIKLTGNGIGEIEIQTDEFSTGIYHYSLEIDGQIIDTKKMSSIK